VIRVRWRFDGKIGFSDSTDAWLGLIAKARKRALLLYLAGPEVETIFATLSERETMTITTKLWKSLLSISRQNRMCYTSAIDFAKQNNV
jgi:hypothetical protein